MKSPKAPTPVDPRVAAQAQTGSNIGTAAANQLMTTNQVTPYGSLSTAQTGTTKYTDPSTGKTYDLPQMTQTSSLSPGQQGLLDAQTQAQTGLAQTAAGNVPKLGSILGKPVNTINATPHFNLIDKGPSLATSYQGADDFSADRTKVEQALMSRMNPALDQARQRREAQLSNQGIKIGTEAFDRAQTQLGQNANDANMQAILAGGQEQSRMVGMSRDAAGFGNDARQSMFDNNMARQGVNNAARQQTFANQNTKAGFNNNSRMQGINEIMAMMQGGQVQNPQFSPTQNAQMPNVDVAGLMANQFGQQNANYQNQVQGRNQMMGGLFSAGTAMLPLMLSDERTKENVEPVGAEFAGNPVYEYNYIGDPDTRHVGVMAQDVKKTHPEAVVPMGKFLGVNYGKLAAVA